MPIRRFIERGVTFGPDELKILSQAFDEALWHLGADGEDEETKRIIACRIITLARQGERNRERLCREAFRSAGLHPVPA